MVDKQTVICYDNCTLSFMESVMVTKSVRGESSYQGMNWIRQEKRLAIYMRDGMACVYCSADSTTERMTLDHVVPFCQGGSNTPNNLVTSCLTCNSSRGSKSLVEFAPESLGYVMAQLVHPIDIKAAKAVIAHRKV